MKLVSFEHHGQASFGAVIEGDRIVDLKPLLCNKAIDLKTLIANSLQAEAAAAAAAANATSFLALSEVELLPVIPNPGQIFCVGLNYGEHVRETGREITQCPVIFMRVPDSQVAHGKDIVRPPESVRLDYEGEIAIIIGKGGRRISEADAWNHIAGYACYNDGTIRDWQAATSQWTPGKNFWRTGGFGPWMVTSDEIAPNQRMRLTTRLNSQVMQEATTDMMIHSIPRQIAYISTFTPLRPGDVIVTGTPGGVGNKRDPQVFMKPGDTVEIEIEAVGVLRNGIRDEAIR